MGAFSFCPKLGAKLGKMLFEVCPNTWARWLTIGRCRKLLDEISDMLDKFISLCFIMFPKWVQSVAGCAL